MFTIRPSYSDGWSRRAFLRIGAGGLGVLGLARLLRGGEPADKPWVRDKSVVWLCRLAESDRVRQIFIRHVFRFFLGRNETPGDAVSLQEAEKAYRDSGGSFKALLVSLLSSESFLYRTVPLKESK
jgi:hypothetical protein